MTTFRRYTSLKRPRNLVYLFWVMFVFDRVCRVKKFNVRVTRVKTRQVTLKTRVDPG
nr:MAG TPA: hypothetical protein [Caudoviricetes sp.]